MSENDAQPGGVPPPIPPPNVEVLPSRKVLLTPDRAQLLGLPLRRLDTAILVLLTLLADMCLYDAGGGLGGATLLVIASVALLAMKGREANPRPYKVCMAILLLAGVLVWSAWWLAIVLATVSIFILAVNLWQPEWSFLESLWAVGDSAVHAPQRLYGHIVASRESPRTAERQPLPMKVVLVPLVVSMVFLVVFAAANPVVSRGFVKVWDNITDFLMNLSDYLNMVRFLFWCGWLLFFAALIRPAVRSIAIDWLMKLDVRLAPREVAKPDESNFMVAFITLICVNVVFLGYNGMDAVYLYFKATLPPGISWTAYTHEGCGWLTFALFLSTVALGYIFWDELNFHARSNRLKGFAALWIAQNALLAVGTLRRVHMYIDYSGLTHLLLTGVYGSLLVMAGLVIMAVKVSRNHNAVWLLRKYVAAFAIGLVALGVTPQGWVCANYNVPRILAGKPHSMWPVVLKELPADALPALIPLVDYRCRDGNAAREKLVREGIGAILGQHLVRLEKEQAGPWTQWQASSWWALKHLNAAQAKINATVPPAQWEAARNRLKQDYDLLCPVGKK